ncbi:TPA: hypothetical protein QDB15_004223 [Burkholderia vietnamiensis]|jgi:hypothetical protein|uniref:Uncharacterized protein n=1 Tax=Burkholderia vietnamiensis TaxID=60552 RepID=A0AA44Y3S8_BURVI|nr:MULTISPECIES: hypothetical protein [Burkholderia]KVR89990.1 hypothetical protein WK28_23345 [Burkholderia vietnamiensis]KVS11244.1 hypothetical protein WK29_19050 [Burkholderia vietnamiensis]KVS16134.1 hypothetical protein WK32_27890 [Burkholderia vietnamiensis]MBR7917083.1 hypothetical protein [Burkholderia vietnamiensis]MBR7974469.1 hypothetical protein [Burkholderia vietnamiensis]
MEIVDLVIEYPSGLSIIDRATYVADLQIVHPSMRVALILKDLGDTEAPPTAFASIDSVEVELASRLDGTFQVVGELAEQTPEQAGLVGMLLGHAWTKDQRQQFGRYAHTISAAAAIGAVGFWHSTHDWTAIACASLSMLVVLAVLLFYVGIHSMNGD